MLNEIEIHDIAKLFLCSKNLPIITPGKVIMPEDEKDEKYRQYMSERNFAVVSFSSNFEHDSYDPYQHLVPSVFIVYVNYITGEVHMPRHMA